MRVAALGVFTPVRDMQMFRFVIGPTEFESRYQHSARAGSHTRLLQRQSALIAYASESSYMCGEQSQAQGRMPCKQGISVFIQSHNYNNSINYFYKLSLGATDTLLHDGYLYFALVSCEFISLAIE
jgi:hypothetical protein